MPTASATLGGFLRRLKRAMAAEALVARSDHELVGQFLASHDETAFQAILHRHGPMVFRVCRRVLSQEQDVEDAFQATFLVLAREAQAIRKQASLASWLHGVAYRAALKARSHAARRRECEARAEGPAPTAPLPDEVSWKELRSVLDEELTRLPEKLRAPLVLCYLEGLTQDEAAQQLGWSKSTCRRNLERGRDLLGARLARRGITLSAALLAPLLSGSEAAAVPAALVEATVRAALSDGPGRAAAARLITSLDGAAKPMLSNKLKVMTSVLLAGVLVGAGLLAHRANAARRPGAQPEDSAPPGARAAGPADKERAKADKPKDGAERVTVRGRVLGPDGKPFAGAKLNLGHYGPGGVIFSVRATSGKDGSFDFTFDRSELDKARSDRPVDPWEERGGFHPVSVGNLVALAEGHGPDWVRVDQMGPEDRVTLRLVPDLPVNGRILDKDGRPVAGARVRVWFFGAHEGEDLGALVDAVRTKNDLLPAAKRWWGPLPGQPEVLKAGADGRFRASGFGRERVVGLDVEGPGIANSSIWVMTRAGDTVVGPGAEKTPAPGNSFRVAPVRLYGATFRHPSDVTRPIRGVVRDKETGKPMAGVRVWADIPIKDVIPAPGTKWPFVSARTDQEGRYELLGLRKAEAYNVHVDANSSRHFAVGVPVKDTPGLGPLAADIKVPAGVVLLRGKVTDKRTGKPVPGARVKYFPLYRNPETDRLADYSNSESVTTAGADGSFMLPGLPGPGVLGALAPEKGAYRDAEVTPRELIAFFDKHKVPLPPGDLSGRFLLLDGRGGMGILSPNSYNVLSLIHPDKKDKEVKHDLGLQSLER
jgi:RNA polymerase sigma factor (sigma-70 family)